MIATPSLLSLPCSISLSSSLPPYEFNFISHDLHPHDPPPPSPLQYHPSSTLVLPLPPNLIPRLRRPTSRPRRPTSTRPRRPLRRSPSLPLLRTRSGARNTLARDKRSRGVIGDRIADLDPDVPRGGGQGVN